MPQWRNRLQKHQGKSKKKTFADVLEAVTFSGRFPNNPIRENGQDAPGMILHPSMRKQWEFHSAPGEPRLYWCLATDGNGIIYNLYGLERNRTASGYLSCTLAAFPNPPIYDRPPSLTAEVEMRFRDNVANLMEYGFHAGTVE